VTVNEGTCVSQPTHGAPGDESCRRGPQVEAKPQMAPQPLVDLLAFWTDVAQSLNRKPHDFVAWWREVRVLRPRRPGASASDDGCSRQRRRRSADGAHSMMAGMSPGTPVTQHGVAVRAHSHCGACSSGRTERTGGHCRHAGQTSSVTEMTYRALRRLKNLPLAPRYSAGCSSR
jgi:hypothetical protein